MQIQSFYDEPIPVQSLQANSAVLTIFNSPYALNLFKQTYDLIPHLFLLTALSKKKSNPAPQAHWGPSWQSYVVSSALGHREDEPLPQAAQLLQKLSGWGSGRLRHTQALDWSSTLPVVAATWGPVAQAPLMWHSTSTLDSRQCLCSRYPMNAGHTPISHNKCGPPNSTSNYFSTPLHEQRKTKSCQPQPSRSLIWLYPLLSLKFHKSYKSDKLTDFFL